MSNSFLIALLSLLPAIAASQVVTIKNDLGKEAVLCSANSITILVTGLKDGKIAIETNNGSVHHDIGTRYKWTPNTLGIGTIYVKKLMPGNVAKCIDSVSYTVKKLVVKAQFAGKTTGKVNHDDVVFASHITPYSDLLECTESVRISGYTAIVLRGKKELLRSVQQGDRISDSVRYFFSQLKNDDIIEFTDISMNDCAGDRNIDSIVLIIANAHRYVRRYVSDTVITDPITQDKTHLSNKYFYKIESSN